MFYLHMLVHFMHIFNLYTLRVIVPTYFTLLQFVRTLHAQTQQLIKLVGKHLLTHKSVTLQLENHSSR